MSFYSNLLQSTCTTKALWFLFHTDLLELNSSKIDRLPRNRSRTWNGRKRFFIGGKGVGKMAIRLKTVLGRNCKKCRKLFESGSAASDFQQLECNTILILDIFFHSERLFYRVVHKLCNRLWLSKDPPPPPRNIAGIQYRPTPHAISAIYSRLKKVLFP